MEFRILGPLEIADGDRLVPLGAGKPRALLAILLIHANEVVSNERLIDDLWPDTPPATATKSVQVYVSQVRKALRGAERADGGDGIVLTRPGGYLLSLAADRLDSNRLEEALQEGRRALERGDPDAAAERLRCGLALWRGPPLSDFRYEAFASPRSLVWMSSAWPHSRSGSKPISPPDVTRVSPRSSSRSSPRSHCASD